MKKLFFVVMALLMLQAVAACHCPTCPSECGCTTDENKWADTVVDSDNVENPDSALGPTDWAAAEIGKNGFLTLDMKEPVCNTGRIDIIVDEDNIFVEVDAKIFVTDDLSHPFVEATIVDWDQYNNLIGVNIPYTGYSKIRYVKIENIDSRDWYKWGRKWVPMPPLKINSVMGCCISCDQDVPEFSAVTAALALFGTGLVLWKKRH